jgi:hypothetical protein
MSITLYQSQTSMFCEKVRIVMRMKNVPFEISDVRPNRQPLIDFSGQRKVHHRLDLHLGVPRRTVSAEQHLSRKGVR